MNNRDINRFIDPKDMSCGKSTDIGTLEPMVDTLFYFGGPFCEYFWRSQTIHKTEALLSMQ